MNAKISNGDKYHQFSYNLTSLTVGNFRGELNIPIFLDNNCTYPLYLRHLMRHDVPYKYQKIPTDNVIMHTGKKVIKVYFGIIIP